MMNQSALLRPDWTPATVALMVLGFMVFWPLGLAMLAYIVFGDRFRSFKQSANQTADGLFSKCRSGGFRSAHFTTGNSAFDDYKAETIRRLEEEQDEFNAFLDHLRKSKDKAEFDQFMAGRRNRPDAGEGNASESQPPAPSY